MIQLHRNCIMSPIVSGESFVRLFVYYLNRFMWACTLIVIALHLRTNNRRGITGEAAVR